MPMYRVDESNVRDTATGEVLPGLVGQQVRIVDRGTSTPYPIYDAASDPIPGSLLTVTRRYTTPPHYIDTEQPADVYLDWLDESSGARGPVDFEPAMRAEARQARQDARDAASAAQTLAVGVVRSINGAVPDEDGAITISGGGGGGGGDILWLPDGADPSVTTRAGTLIVRSGGAPPVTSMEVIASTRTTASSESASEISLAVPSGTTTGDLLIAVTHLHTTGATASAPSGWTRLQELDTSVGDFRTTTIWGYRVTSTPPSSATFSWNVGGRSTGTMARVVGVDLDAPVLASGEIGERPTGSTYTVPELEGSADGLILEVTVGQVSPTASPFPLVYSETMSTVIEASTSGDTSAYSILGVAWAIAEAGDWPQHTVATADNSVNALGAQVLALRGVE